MHFIVASVALALPVTFSHLFGGPDSDDSTDTGIEHQHNHQQKDMGDSKLGRQTSSVWDDTFSPEDSVIREDTTGTFANTRLNAFRRWKEAHQEQEAIEEQGSSSGIKQIFHRNDKSKPEEDKSTGFSEDIQSE